MTREIKFRAKSTVTEEWLYSNGYYFDGFNYWFILPCPGNKAHNVESICFAIAYSNQRTIDIETLGEYTGLKDKQGKEIYEGDILKATSELMTNFGRTRTGKYQEDFYSIEYNDTEAQFKKRDTKTNCLNPLGLSQSILSKYSEVIGNIYDNLELLKEGK